MTRHIVHVDDEKDLRIVFSEIIAIIEPGIILNQFPSADASLAFIGEKGNTIDVFVLDIRVPGQLSGLDLAAKIRELGCNGHIIITSAYQMPPIELLQTLRAEYISKPWDVPEFFTHILS